MNIETVTSIYNQHAAFCSQGQEALLVIDPNSDIEYAMIDQLFDAYASMMTYDMNEDAADEWLQAWSDLESDERFDEIEELVEAA